MASVVLYKLRKATNSIMKREEHSVVKKTNEKQISVSWTQELFTATPDTPAGRYGLVSSKYTSSFAHFAILYSIKNIGNKFAGVRIDKPHAGAPARLPSGTAAAAGALNTTLKIAGDLALAGAIVYDTCKVTSAVCSEIMEKGRPGIETGREVAAVAGTYSVGAVGAATGNTVGSWVGAGVGALFGGAGAVSGAAVGSLVGGLCGGIYGALMGRSQGRSAVDAYFCKTKEETSPSVLEKDSWETAPLAFLD